MTYPPPRITRRTLLGGALYLGAGAVLAACGADGAAALPGITTSGGGATASPASGAPAAPATPASDAALRADPGESAAAALAADARTWVVPRAVRQGAAFLIAIDGAAAGVGSVAFNGQVMSLLREGSRLYTILGIDALTPVGPLPVNISLAEPGGRLALVQETLAEVTTADWQTEVIELDASNRELLDPAVRAEDAAARDPVFRRITPERHWNGVFDPPSRGVITSSYGLLRSYNFGPVDEYHTGLDFAGEVGDPILAPNAGVVAWVGQTRRRGNGLVIDHGGGVFSGYYHMSEAFLSVGAVVKTGDFIGRIGATGLATGPHLHWEMIVHAVTVDPVQWLRIAEYPDPAAVLDPADAIKSPNQIAP